MKTTKQKPTSLKLGESTSAAWLKSKRTRPKQVVAVFNRTATGYLLEEAIVVNKVNQHVADFVPMDVRALKADINKKGFTVK